MIQKAVAFAQPIRVNCIARRQNSHRMAANTRQHALTTLPISRLERVDLPTIRQFCRKGFRQFACHFQRRLIGGRRGYLRPTAGQIRPGFDNGIFVILGQLIHQSGHFCVQLCTAKRRIAGHLTSHRSQLRGPRMHHQCLVAHRNHMIGQPRKQRHCNDRRAVHDGHRRWPPPRQFGQGSAQCIPLRAIHFVKVRADAVHQMQKRQPLPTRHTN
jgi:hypothetical protein